MIFELKQGGVDPEPLSPEPKKRGRPKGAKDGPAARQRCSEGQVKRYADPEARAQTAAATGDVEKKLTGDLNNERRSSRHQNVKKA